MVKESEVAELLSAFEPQHTSVVDFSDGCGAKFDVVVVSDHFKGKRVLERHRMVNEALKEIQDAVHAVTIKALTSEQWAAELAK